MKIRAFAICVALAMISGISAFGAPAKGQGQAIQIIDGPRVEGTGDTWAVIAWTTNEGGSSIVHYGTSQNTLTQTAETPYAGAKVQSGKVTHRVQIKNLQPNTTYYYQVDSGQGSGSGTESKSSVLSFQTKGAGQSSAAPAATGADGDENVQQPKVNITDGPRLEGVGSTWAVIAWTTNAPSNSIVRYGYQPNVLNQTAEAPYADTEKPGAQTHRVRLTNLHPNVTYYYVVYSGQGEGTGTSMQSTVQTFNTPKQ